MPSKQIKNVLWDIYGAQIWLNWQDIQAISGQWLDVSGYQDCRYGVWLATLKFGFGYLELDEEINSQARHFGIFPENTSG